MSIPGSVAELKLPVESLGQHTIQDSKFKIIISSEKLKRGRTLTISQYTITHIVYFKTQRRVIENTKVK